MDLSQRIALAEAALQAGGGLLEDPDDPLAYLLDHPHHALPALRPQISVDNFDLYPGGGIGPSQA